MNGLLLFGILVSLIIGCCAARLIDYEEDSVADDPEELRLYIISYVL